MILRRPRFKKTATINGKRQQGVAIITALLIVAIATTVSVTISTRLQLDVRRTGNLVATDQAHIYSLIAEKALRVILKDDELRDGFIKMLIIEGIARQPLFIDNASIEAEVTDLSACININSLVDTGGAINTVAEARLTSLFTNAGISNNLTQAIADWIDPDLTDQTPNGAEDGYYMNLEKPYRTAQSPLYSISELRLIRGFENNEDYQRIRTLIDGTYDEDSGRFSGPSLCAFHTANATPININTASVEVLKSLQPNITQAQIEDILQQRTDGALSAVPAVFKTPDNLATDSSYYLLRSKVSIGNANKVMYSIIYWDGAETSTVYRVQRTL
jgi:general secretion pathway protein K